MRQVGDPAGLPDAIASCMREAEGAFGDPAVFIEQAVVEPRHIEVQILADGHGGVIHLYERDCSVQRRHRKVIEMAPAPHLDAGLRARICADAVRFASQIGYVNAGTVEFLLDPSGGYVFIEMNPRIQVEHTVTEEITDIDLVQAQLRIAAGETLDDLGLSQDAIKIRGAALQCRITTEDLANGFRPDTGMITTYRSPGGAGIRLDGGTTYTGAEVSAHFDSMLAKLTYRGRTHQAAVDRARGATAEFRIRGVATNIPFLQAVLDDPDFQAGRLTTSFIETHPQLLTARSSADRGTKLLTYLAGVSINQPHGPRPVSTDPVSKLPETDLGQAPPAGSRQRLASLGPQKFARRLRAQTDVAVTDTTFRDAHQSLLATRVRTRDLLERRRARRADHAWAAVAGGLGRRDLRRGAPLPRRGPVAAPGRPPRRCSQHLPADAGARPQHGRLYPLPGRSDGSVRAGGGGDRRRYLPHFRRAKRRQPDAPGHRAGHPQVRAAVPVEADAALGDPGHDRSCLPAPEPPLCGQLAEECLRNIR
jgi:pyruvate carboxylase